MEKRIKKVILFILGLVLFIPNVVRAENTANISVSGPSQGIVGNQLSITVTISSNVAMSGYDVTLSYDKSLLQLSSVPSTDNCNGTRCIDAVGKNIKSVTLTYKFKVLKSGTVTVSAVQTSVLDVDREEMKKTNGSKKITLKTQAEIEASYSSDAYLKTLTVGEYTLDPVFNKDTKEYTVEVPNEVDKVTITASKNDANASVSGTGEKELKEGSNKFEIVCTAQKGNSLTYTVTVNRKELNPIPVTINGKSFTIIRKSEELPEYKSFIAQTINYNEDEIPALVNEGIKYTLIGVKDDEGNVHTYIFDNGNIKDEYYEITTGDLTILPKSVDEAINDLVRREININGHTVIGYSFKDNSKQVIIKGINVYNGNESYYLYDTDNKIFITFNVDDISELNKQNDTFKLIIIILGVIIVLLIILVIIKKPSSKKKKKADLFEEDEEEVEIDDSEDIKELIEKQEEKNKKEVKEEIKEEVVEDKKEEEIEEQPEEHKKLSRRARKKIAQEEKKRLEELEKKDVESELEEEIKKQEEELKARKEKMKKESEEVEEDDFVEAKNSKVIDEDVDDPLNSEDDYSDFWKTMDINSIDDED